jgi:hypothetical protein
LDGDTGQLQTEMGNIVSGKRRFAFGESEILYYNNGSKTFQLYGIPDLTLENSLGSQLSEDVLGKDWHFYMNPDTWELYLCNTTGVYKAQNYQNSDEIDCLTTHTDLSDTLTADTEILSFLVGEDEDFYLCLLESTEEYGVVSKQYRMIHWTKED